MEESELRGRIAKALAGAARVAVLGIGSDLRADDVCGMKVAECLAADSSLETLPVEIFLGQTAPENLLGKIRKFNPSHLLVTDAVSFGGRPGDVRLFLGEDLRGGTFSTHGFPLSVFLEYARKEFRCEALVVGIEPESVTLGKPLSRVVGERLSTVARAVREALVEVFASGASGQKNGEK